LLVETPDHATLVDTGWSDAQASELVIFAASRGRPVRAAIVTHFHEDRVGGVRALIARGIPVFASAATLQLAQQTGRPVPDRVLEQGSIPELRWIFPGAAHSPDNIVVFHEPTRTLFGGCMIKALASETLGNVTDADVAAWPAAIAAIRESFAEAVHVVPGHGSPGGAGLVAHTASLLGMDECGTDTDCLVSIESLLPCSCCGCVEPRSLPRARAMRDEESSHMSCEPICDDVVCALCAPQQALLPQLRAACRDTLCIVLPIE
jgi:metallo-beta-lactamase class B